MAVFVFLGRMWVGGGWQMEELGEGYDMLFKGNANRNAIKKNEKSVSGRICWVKQDGCAVKTRAEVHF